MDSAMHYAALAAAVTGIAALTIFAVMEYRDAQIRKKKVALRKRLLYVMTCGSSGSAALKAARPSGLSPEEEKRALAEVALTMQKDAQKHWDRLRYLQETHEANTRLLRSGSTQAAVKTPVQQNPGYKPCSRDTGGRGASTGSVGEVDYIAASQMLQMQRTEVASWEELTQGVQLHRSKGYEAALRPEQWIGVLPHKPRDADTIAEREKAPYEVSICFRTGSSKDTPSQSASESADALRQQGVAAVIQLCGGGSSRSSYSGCSSTTSGSSSIDDSPSSYCSSGD